MTTPFAHETAEPRSPGDALVAELRWVHDAIRHDLAVVRQLSQHVLNGSPPAEITLEVGRLQTSSPLWELRRTNPALGPVVDKLEADHRVVGDYLDEIEAAVAALARVDTTAGRQRVAAGLDGLAAHLLAHLAFEEVEISPTLLQWERWPGF